jgi:hypothetical protein
VPAKQAPSLIAIKDEHTDIEQAPGVRRIFIQGRYDTIRAD